MKNPRTTRRALAAAATLHILAGAAVGQCAHGWADGLAEPGVTLATSMVRGLTTYDDGSGPALFASGWIATAGGSPANRIAKWNGANWSPLGTGISGQTGAGPRVMAVYSGQLYVGGNFTTAGGVPVVRIARWNGTAWAPVGSGITGAGSPDVIAMKVYNDGSGAALYVGGLFDTAGGVPAANIAKWDGNAWAALAGGAGPDGAVNALEVFDDGSGPALYAGGAFLNAGGAPATRVARWNGSGWAALGSGLSPNHVDALTVYDAGTGPALYAGGLFALSGVTAVNNVGRWNPGSQTWTAVGGGTSGQVWALSTFDDDGPGPHAAAMYAGGAFAQAGGQSIAGLARWNGTSWSSAGSGTTITVGALAAWNDQRGPALFAAGGFGTSSTFAGLDAGNIARYDGSAAGGWTTLGSGMDAGVNAAASFDDGTGAAMFVTGTFIGAGGVPCNRLAKRTGSTWAPVGPIATNGLSAAGRALLAYTAGGTHDLYVAGDFTTAGGVTANHVAKWDGAIWSALGSGAANGVNGTVGAMTVYDDGTGPAVYVGGTFSTAGGLPAANVARWDPVLSTWAPLGLGTNAAVNALAVFDEDGPGPNPPVLFAGGTFTTAGGAAASHIARWDGAAWSPLMVGANNGVNSTVNAFMTYSDSNGPALFAGGGFTTAGGVAANRVGRWSGSAWTSLGTAAANGVNNAVNSMAVYDDGTGSALFVGGIFTAAGGLTAGHIARWSNSWSAVGSTGTNGTVSALASFITDPAGAALWVGGAFDSADGKPSSNIGRWTVVGPSPVIGQQPQPHAAYTTQPTSFSVAATGSNLTYQWRFSGIPLSNGGRISGATSPVLTLNAVQPSDAGPYDVLVYGCLGVTPSSPALLTVVCYANCDQSTIAPILNVNDFQCFLNHFAAGDPYANCDGSTTAPALNVLDFTCFLNGFAAGCP